MSKTATATKPNASPSRPVTAWPTVPDVADDPVHRKVSAALERIRELRATIDAERKALVAEHEASRNASASGLDGIEAALELDALPDVAPIPERLRTLNARYQRLGVAEDLARQELERIRREHSTRVLATMGDVFDSIDLEEVEALESLLQLNRRRAEYTRELRERGIAPPQRLRVPAIASEDLEQRIRVKQRTLYS